MAIAENDHRVDFFTVNFPATNSAIRLHTHVDAFILKIANHADEHTANVHTRTRTRTRTLRRYQQARMQRVAFRLITVC